VESTAWLPCSKNRFRALVGLSQRRAAAEVRALEPAGGYGHSRDPRPCATGLTARPNCPRSPATLVVVGNDDALSPPAEAHAMAAAMPNARVVEIRVPAPVEPGKPGRLYCRAGGFN